MNTRQMAYIALSAALIAVLAPLSIPLPGQVPVSLATLAVMTAGLLLGARDAAIAAGIYLVLGILGLPVFAGFTSGAAVLFGLTGGFLFGYVPLAFLSGLAAGKKVPVMLCGMIAGTVVLYTLGTVWFMYEAGKGIVAALTACVLPFLPGDALKIAAACLLGQRLAPYHARAAAFTASHAH